LQNLIDAQRALGNADASLTVDSAGDAGCHGTDGLRRTMAFRLNSVCAALVGILAFSHQPAFAASSLMGHHSGSFSDFRPCCRWPVFESLKPAILPGSPIFGMPVRSEPGVEMVDAGRIRTMQRPRPSGTDQTGPPRVFCQRFIGAENIEELHCCSV